MRNIIIIFTLFLTFQAFSQEEEEYSSLSWLTDINEAKQESKATKKPILMFFTGSDWCPPCKSLKHDFFNSEAFEKKAKNFVLLIVDMPRRIDIITAEQKVKNEALVRKYNTKGSYPNIVALNDDLNVIGELSGYTFLRETDRHFAFVDSILENY